MRQCCSVYLPEGGAKSSTRLSFCLNSFHTATRPVSARSESLTLEDASEVDIYPQLAEGSDSTRKQTQQVFPRVGLKLK